MIICNHSFHAVFIQQSSGKWLSYKDGMKPVFTDKVPQYQIYWKTNIYLSIIISYNLSIYLERERERERER